MKNIKEIIIGVLILAFLGIMCFRQTESPNLDFRIIDSKINTNYLSDNKDKMIIIKCIINDGDTTIIKKFGDKQMDFSTKHINILLDEIDNHKDVMFFSDKGDSAIIKETAEKMKWVSEDGKTIKIYSIKK